MKKIILFGIGEFAEMVHHYLSQTKDYEVVAFTVNKRYKKTDSFCGLPIIEFENIEQSYSVHEYYMLISVGYSNLNQTRANAFKKAKEKGYLFISYIHPSNILDDNVEIGENCIIFENNVIEPFVKIGNDVIVWANNTIAHNVKIDDDTFISSNTVLAGNVSLGKRCFIGVGSIVKENIKIGNDVIIGTGSLILKDAHDKSSYISIGSDPSQYSSDIIKKFL